MGLRLPHYAVAGVVTLAVEYWTFLGGYYIIHLAAVIANTLSFVVSVSVNFLLNRMWVFNAGLGSRSWRRQVTLYFCLALLNLGITNLGLYYLLQFHIPAFLLKLLFVSMVASWNFIIFRKFIFGDTNH